jgi:hypothetical protein
MAVYNQVTASPGYEVMADWGDTYLGAVTGNNNYFTLTRNEATDLGLQPTELARISPPGSKHLRGLTFSEHAWNSMAEEGARCYLFAPSEAAGLSSAAKRYIEAGLKRKVHQAYKCKVREPWWRVPLVARPDFLFTYMNHERPRLVRNGAGVQFLNSVYGVRLHAVRRSLGERLLAIASLNSVTLLGAEIIGRSYGGGMLKHEPTEVAALPVPSDLALEKIGPQLSLIASQVAATLRGDDITPAIEMVDGVVLRDCLALSDDNVRALRDAREALLQRRMTRAKGSHGER